MFTVKVDEKLIAEKFGDGRQVDVSDITVEFDLPVQIGRNKGESRCQQLYKGTFKYNVSTLEGVGGLSKNADTADAGNRES